MMNAMCAINWFRDGKSVRKTYSTFVPRVGDTIRFSKTIFGEVCEVCWCLDEDKPNRVNIGTRTLKP